MSDERIREWLQEADRAAGEPLFGHVSAAGIRRRIRRRRLMTMGVPAAAAAVLLFGWGLWSVCTRVSKPAPQQQERILTLETQVKQLQAQTDAALKLVHEVLARERQAQRLEALEAELASIPDPLEELEKQADKTAFIMVYQADRLYRELNQVESAVEAYEQVIQLFPRNQWAATARKRLSEIRRAQTF